MDYDYPDYGDAPPGTGRDPFEDYDYETLLGFYDQFKDSNPQVAQMIQMGLAKKRLQASGNVHGQYHDPMTPKFNEQQMVLQCSQTTFVKTLDYIKLLILALIFYRLLKATVFKFLSNDVKHFLTTALGLAILHKIYQQDVYLILPQLLFYLTLKFLKTNSKYTNQTSQNSTDQCESTISPESESTCIKSTNETSEKMTSEMTSQKSQETKIGKKSDHSSDWFTIEESKSTNAENVSLVNSNEISTESYRVLLKNYIKEQEPDYIAKQEENEPVSVILIFFHVLTLLATEIYYPKQNWSRVRGTNMILTFKIIHVLSCKYDASSNLLEQLAYILHPGTVIFGPFTTFEEFRESFCRAKYGIKSLIHWKTLIISTIVFILAMSNLILSNCVMPYLFQDPYPDKDDEGSLRSLTGIKLKGYQSMLPIFYHINMKVFLYCLEIALTFRTNWYYIAFLSTLFSTLTDQIDSQKFSNIFYVCNPFSIEFPFCISKVVRDWNKPFSKWLNISIFAPINKSLKLYCMDCEYKWYSFVLDFRKFYKLLVMFVTFCISCLYHGIDVRINCILGILCLVSWVQHSLRKELSLIYDNSEIAPLNSKLRKLLKQPNKQKFITRFILNPFIKTVFFTLNYTHLIYLGGIMLQVHDNYSQKELLELSVQLWYGMHFITFKITAALVIVYLFIK